MSATDLVDFRLVVAIVDSGSIAAAAVHLRMAQPSASERLARLERSLGVVLFDRSRSGARPTPAGHALATRGRRVLELVEEATVATRSAAARPALSAGTIPSLAPAVFAALDAEVGRDRVLRQRTEHGRTLVSAVSDGALDVAVVATGALRLPAALVRHDLGTDQLVLAGLDAGRVADPAAAVRDRDVVVHTYAENFEAVAAALGRRGARPRRAATSQTAVAMAVGSGDLAVLPRSAVDAGSGLHVLGAARLGAPIGLGLVSARGGGGHVPVERLIRVLTHRLQLRRPTAPVD